MYMTLYNSPLSCCLSVTASNSPPGTLDTKTAEFTFYVKEMHANRDEKFEQQYEVRQVHLKQLIKFFVVFSL